MTWVRIGHFSPAISGVPGAGAKKTPAQGGRQVIEAGFIQARNLSSSALVIDVYVTPAKRKFWPPDSGRGRVEPDIQASVR